MTITDNPTSPTGPVEAELLYCLHSELLPAADNLRGAFTDVSELADSIAESGLLQPLKVTLEEGRPRIAAGNRRHAAIGKLIADGRWPAGRRIPCIHDGDLDDEQRTVAMLVENLQRVDLDPVEEARGYERLKAARWKPARIAAATGRPVDRVNTRLKLLTLPDKAQEWISDGTLSLERAAQLIAAPAPAIKALCARKPTPPSEWEIGDAVRTWERAEVAKAGRALADERGIEFSTKQKWQLLASYVELSHCRYDRLDGWLIPDGAVLVSLEESNLIVWQAREATTGEFTGKKKAKTPVDEWMADCARLRDEHRNAVAAWDQRRQELMATFVDTQRTKDVAASAMWWICAVDMGSTLDEAKAAGWWSWPAGPDADGEMDAFEAWLKVPANLTKCVARTILASYSDVQSALEKNWDRYVESELGAKPTLAIPTRPDLTAAGDTEEGDDDD